jgi:hypothetical protein
MLSLDYEVGKFFVQAQAIADYYFQTPETSNPRCIFAASAGVDF